MISVEAPAGSLIVFESRLWHQTGDNVTDDVVRAAIFGFYQKPLYMPAENWFMQTKPEVVRHGSEELLTLMGFRDPSLGQKRKMLLRELRHRRTYCHVSAERSYLADQRHAQRDDGVSEAAE